MLVKHPEYYIKIEFEGFTVCNITVHHPDWSPDKEKYCADDILDGLDEFKREEIANYVTRRIRKGLKLSERKVIYV